MSHMSTRSLVRHWRGSPPRAGVVSPRVGLAVVSRKVKGRLQGRPFDVGKVLRFTRPASGAVCAAVAQWFPVDLADQELDVLQLAPCLGANLRGVLGTTPGVGAILGDRGHQFQPPDQYVYVDIVRHRVVPS